MIKLHSKFKGKSYVIAVSTGVDSMVLLDMYKNEDIIVAHVNHQKREQSKDEELFIKEYCDQHSIPIEVLHLPEGSGNFQSYARDERYKFFYEVCKKHNKDAIVTAHHADDLVETILMNASRGSGVKGLIGMTEESTYLDLNLIKPLLSFSKNEIQDYQKEHQIKYFEDASNEDDIYTRNRYRNHIVPLLVSEQQDLHHKYYELSNMMKNIDDHFKSFIAEQDLNSVNNYLKQDQITRYYILEELASEFELSIHSSLFDDLDQMISSTAPNKMIHLTKEVVLEKAYDQIKIKQLKKLKDIYYEINDFGIYHIDKKQTILVTDKLSDKHKKHIKLCYNERAFPIVIRTRLDGDKFSFNYGTKKLKNLLIDLKVPLQKRNELLLVEVDDTLIGIPELSLEVPQVGQNTCYIVLEEE